MRKSKTPAVLETCISHNGDWKWEVLRKYNRKPESDLKPYARWFCRVTSPFCPEGELGDVYVSEIMAHAKKVEP